MVEFFRKRIDSITTLARAGTDDRLRQYMVAILAAALAVMIRGALNPFLQSDHAFVLSLLAVVAVAWQGGFGPALVTLVLSLSGTVYFFLEPRWEFALLSRSDRIAVALFFVCGLVAALLGEAQRNSRQRAEDNLADNIRKQATLEAEIARRHEIEVALRLREAERLRSEERLRQSEERYRGLTQAVPQMVRVTDAAGVMTFCNQRWVDYTGITLAEGREKGWMSAVHPDDVPALAAAWRAALSGQTPRLHHEYRLRRVADGAYRWMLSVAVPSHDDAGAVEWVGTLTDIDEQKRASEYLERMVRDRTLELSHANEALRGEVEERGHAEARERAAGVELLRSNHELEQFAYVASHDLQEPLRKIQAFGDRLHHRFHDQLAEQGRDYIDRMLSSAVRMRRLIDDLLMFSRVTTKPQSPVPIDLDAILAGVLTDLEVGIEKAGATVVVGSLPEIEADPMQMRQLFQNLIGNALKFAAPDTPPRLRIFADRAEPPAGDAPAGDWWRISFEDNGIGFDEKYTDRIFQVFQRLHGRDEYEGTGVGLAICRKIAERHGGEINAKSRPGAGATFTVTLPAIQP